MHIYTKCNIINLSDSTAPSVPRDLRAFVTHVRSPLSASYRVQLDIHWSYPEHPNGQISHYFVYISRSPEGVEHRHQVVNKMYFRVGGALPNQTYAFKVSMGDCDDKVMQNMIRYTTHPKL